ncbi:hypothetical protein [Rugamonas sp.]|uniref:LPS translocon maturation chaperone LptM n=1 Tax=Rugamonas sp. TaxID=1926287 RepID=UPI0025DE11D1|nr:hypothetical protein [Rugamonas sp.]
MSPRFTRLYRAAGAAACLSLLLGACGQPGPLYIPKPSRPANSKAQLPGQEAPTPTPPIPSTLPPAQQ